MAMIVWWYLAL